jgi:alkanesulfonate monooxygenase SsuD/methylene tetrahydromethanopterin reductase-like flavin-dependent oxidoreductase (luciferase family)
MAMARPVRGFGVAATVPVEILRELAVAAEAAGYRTFWVNNPAKADGIQLLADVARATSTIRLGVGVIPVDSFPPDEILKSLRRTGLDQGRLTLGVGSSRRPNPLARVRQACEQLSAETEATVVIGALGPKMLRLAGEAADGVLLNWLTPNYVAPSADQVIEAAREVGRPRPRIDGYVRCALGPEALQRLQSEAERYTGIPSYGAHFTRMQVRAIDTAVVGLQPEAIQRGLAEYDGKLDEVVLRAIVGEETLENYLALLKAGAPKA